MAVGPFRFWTTCLDVRMLAHDAIALNKYCILEGTAESYTNTLIINIATIFDSCLSAFSTGHFTNL